MKQSLNLLYISLLAFLPIFTTHAQSWQWAQKASYGKPNILPAPGNVSTIIDMATDPKGNVYTLAYAYDSLLVVNGLSKSGFGKYDMLLTSHSCDGAYRWSKIIGTTTDSDVAVAVRTDQTGGVYVCGMMTMTAAAGASSGGHIDSDTVIGNTTRTMFLAKWDTTGNYKWARLPQPDTISSFIATQYSRVLDMDVDESGNAFMLAYLSRGAYAGGYVISTPGLYVLKYSTAGQLIGGVPLQISLTLNVNPAMGYNIVTLQNYRLVYNGAMNRFIVSGTSNIVAGITIGTTTLANGANYIATFNSSTGALGFSKSVNDTRVTIRGRPAIDGQNNIYVCGVAGDSASFNGVTFNNLGRRTIFSPYAMKMDKTTGNPIWTTSSRANGTNIFCYGLSVANSRVAIVGQYKDSLVLPNTYLYSSAATDSNQGYIIQMDAGTGAVQQAISVGAQNNENIHSVTSDKRGNFYVGGNYGFQGLNIGSTYLPYNSINYFTAKWGWANCICTVPVPSFSAAMPVGKSVKYTYTGSTGGVDSLVWDYGDGTKQKVTTGFGTPVTHTFGNNGRYNVCVTAYNDSCGSTTFCGQTGLSIAGFLAFESFKVYPNPFLNYVIVEGASDADLFLYNSIGQLVHNARISHAKERIDLRPLPTGIYTLQITDSKGARGRTGLIKL